MTPNALLAAAAAASTAGGAEKTQQHQVRLFDHEERRVSGAAVPASLRDALLGALDTARWPPVTHRHRVESERYLVVTAEIKGGRGGGAAVVDPYLAGSLSIYTLICMK